MILRTAISLSWIAILAMLAGCAETKDWDKEIIVAIFKPSDAVVGALNVSATQGGKKHGPIDVIAKVGTSFFRKLQKQPSSPDSRARSRQGRPDRNDNGGG